MLADPWKPCALLSVINVYWTNGNTILVLTLAGFFLRQWPRTTEAKPSAHRGLNRYGLYHSPQSKSLVPGGPNPSAK